MKLPRRPHTDRAWKTGQYKKTPPCDGCCKPVGTAYFTDYEVCGDNDSPGFYLCDRPACMRKRTGLSIEERRKLYTSQRSNQ